MKAYLIVTGVVFTLITVAHVARVFVESGGFAHDPWFLALTTLAAGLSVWAWGLLWRALRANAVRGRNS